MLNNVTWFCFFASYVLTGALETARLWQKGALFRWTALGFGLAGFLAHTAYLLERARTAELPPLLSSGHDWLLVLAWLAVLMYLFVGLLDRSPGFGLFLLPIVVIVVGAARFVSSTTNPTLNAQRSWGMLHAAMWVLGAAGVIVGLVLSVMYLIQHRRLRQKASLHAGVQLPSLERLGRLNWWAVVVSVPLLTIGMVTGVGLTLINDGELEPVPLTQPGILISAVVWLVMMALFVWLLVARRTPGRLVAWRTVWAAGFLLVTLIVLQLFNRGGVHGVAGSGDLRFEISDLQVQISGFRSEISDLRLSVAVPSFTTGRRLVRCPLSVVRCGHCSCSTAPPELCHSATLPLCHFATPPLRYALLITHHSSLITPVRRT